MFYKQLYYTFIINKYHIFIHFIDIYVLIYDIILLMKTIGKKDTYNLFIDNNKLTVRTNTHEDDSRYYWNVDKHCNAEFEIHIILNGKCETILDDNKVLLDQGYFLLISPGCYHSANTLSNKFEHFCFSFVINEGYIKKSFNSISSYIISKTNNKMEQYCLAYQNECEKNSSYNYDSKRSIISLIIIEILKQMNIENNETITNSNGINSIDIIDQFFEQYYSDNCGEEKLANLLFVSKRQLSRYMKKIYGMTYREKLINTRLEHAKWLLLNSNLDIASISKMIGYSSETSFYNMFSSQYNISPQKYRNTKKKGQ